MVDWGAGEYENTAAELEPVAEHVVELAGCKAGERVVDLATGTGNAALRATRAGAVVTGIDGAPRLIDVARDRAAAAGLDASFVVGDFQALPFDDGSFDVALSVFGLIFATQPSRAFEEMIRVLGPGGRAVISAWVPAGPIDSALGTLGRAVAAATGSSRDRFAWHDPAAVGELAARHRAQLELHEGQLPITAASAEACVERNAERSPMGVAGRAVLERAGTWEDVRRQVITILREANEDPCAFRVTSPYRVFAVRKLG
jgi:SAM-dependent methyltransferase